MYSWKSRIHQKTKHRSVWVHNLIYWCTLPAVFSQLSPGTAASKWDIFYTWSDIITPFSFNVLHVLISSLLFLDVRPVLWFSYCPYLCHTYCRSAGRFFSANT